MDALAAATRQELIDRLESPTCVVDADGVVRLVNRAWREFGTANGAGSSATQTPNQTGCGLGGDYHVWLDDRDDVLARRAARGVFDVIEGRLGHFDLVYPCDAPHESRWFRLLVAPLTDPAPRPVLAVHVRLDDRHGAREYSGTDADAPTLTVCAWCNAQQRTEDGRWIAMSRRPPADVAVSHGICAECATEYLRELAT